MTLALKPYANFVITTGTTLNNLDYTGPYDPVTNPGGYGAPNLDASLVTCTRSIFSSYLQEINAGGVTQIIAGTEYIVGGTGSLTYDTKVYTVGETFISMLSGTPTLGTNTLTATGRFSSTSSFLPTMVIGPDLTPSLAIGTSDLIFPDSSYSLQYDIFTGNITASSGIASGTYIVFGTPGQTITISGVTYRINEVFTQPGSFTMTGTGSIGLFNTTATVDFQLSYYANKSKIDYELRTANSHCGSRERLEEALEEISNDLTAIEDYFDSDRGTDFSGTQILFDEIASIAAINA